MSADSGRPMRVHSRETGATMRRPEAAYAGYLPGTVSPAPAPRPPPGDADAAAAAAGVLVREVLARHGQPRASLLDPVGRRRLGGLGGFGGDRHRVVARERQRSRRVDFAGRAWIHVFLLWRASTRRPERPDLHDES